MGHFKQSLAVRLAILIVLGAGLVLLVVLTFSHVSLRRLFVQQVHERGDILTRSAVNRIESRMGRAEATVREAAAAFALLAEGRDQAQALIRASLADHTGLSGMTIALAPSGAPRSDHRMFSGWRRDSAILLRQDDLPGNSFQQDWFYLPYYLQRPVWTEPYYDNQTEATMVTYAVPILRQGQVWAVVSGDISLEWIRNMLDELPLGAGGLAILLSRRGHYISHPVRELEMRETVFSLAESLATPTARKSMADIGRRMLLGQPGQLSYRRPLDDRPAFLHYRPVPSSGWALGVVIPEQQVIATTLRLNRINGLVGLGGMSLLLIAALGVGWSVARPLKKLATAADRLAQGDFDAPLPAIRSRDEVGRLNDSFARMRVDLRRYITELTATTAAKEKIASELAIAREIQLGIVPKLFPAFPNRSDLDLYARLVPALEVGGDFYDFTLLDDNHLYIAIGDVSGKGVPASLMMAVGKTLLKSVIQTVRDPAQALKQVNDELAEDNDSCMFITAFCGILNLQSGDLIYANAGHNPPLLLRSGQDVTMLEAPPGPALGAMAGGCYESCSMQLAGDDLLLLYTDGVTEAMDPEHKLFGDERLLQTARGHRDVPARSLIEAVDAAVRQHAGSADQSDDLTLLAVRYRVESGRAVVAGEAGADPPVAVLSLLNRLPELARLTGWVKEQAQAFGLPAQAAMHLNLALEEWLVNIISYGYCDDHEHLINLRLWADAQRLRIEVEDDGQPFDPTARGEVDTGAALEDRQVGGLGIHFIRQTMDDFNYRREQNRNIVTLSLLRREAESTGEEGSC